MPEPEKNLPAAVPECPIHHRPLICPSCAGAVGGKKGGSSRSEAKRNASKENIAKAQKGRKKAAKRRRSLKNVSKKGANEPKKETE